MATSFLEKNLEDIIFESDRTDLLERGIDVEGQLFRQYRLGKYGIADLIGFKEVKYDSYIQSDSAVEYIVTIYELKRGKIDFNTFMQAIRYVYGFICYAKINYKRTNFQFRIVLIGSEIENKDEFINIPNIFVPKYLIREDLNKIIDIEFYTYSYNINGILFSKIENYC